MASSSSSSSRKYEVFLSFRGEDTRDGFTSHLAAALRRKQIEFFIDDEELKKGDEISPALSNAIETADISIIIFSKDYASSKWCLNELVKILDCKNMDGQIVIPVFYHVDPSDVRKQNGSFEESFVVHERNFKEMPEKVRKWRAALTEAANLSGHNSTEPRNEAELVEKIAADISKKLEDMSGLTDLDGFVGLKSRIEEIKTMLCLEMLDVRVIGIWGMGGIGKTTLANVVFDQISRKFEGKCFMENVRKKTNETGVINVRDEVISLVLGGTRKLGTPIISSEIQKKLQRKKALIVLDDVHDDFTQLDRLARGLLDSLAGSKTGSRIIIPRFLIFFSKDYASSKWCLNELVKILDCKNMNGQIVIPVFYHVDPADVRKPKGSFGESFVVHEQNFKEMPEKVHKWRAALTEAANLSGYDSTESRNEAELWGFGRIGKTTLASAVFRQISRKFQGRCFMEDVREETKRMGAKYVRDEVICQVLDESIKIGTPIISSEIKKRLQRKKVLIVLDDVHDDFTQLESLAGGLLESLAGSRTGSRIIITTRDEGILDKCGVNNVYEVKGLIHYQALELFCRQAFRQNNRSDDLLKLSEQVVCYANGNPLALKVLGGSFHQKSKQQWEDKLLNLKLISERDIYKVLKISYDELNEGEKQIFLDIACFFRGEEIDLVRRVSTSVDTLVDKSLITIGMNRVQMHDLLQEMGREIVHQESINEPGKRSRLWYHKDIRRVLKQNMETDKIEGIFLDMSVIKDIYLSPAVFANMPNLRLLKFYMPGHKYDPNTSSKVHVEQGLECLPKELRYLHWHQYPLKTLPFHFKPKNLVVVNLPFSNLEQLWEGKKKALKLKYIDLSHSQNLTRLWDTSETPILSNCTKFPSSIQNYNHLSMLSFKHCQSLRSFPNNLDFDCPVTIDFSCCENLTEFPNISGNIKELILCYTAIEEVPSSIQNFNHLSLLSFNGCRSLRSFPNNLHFVCPVIIKFFSCKNLKKFPEICGKIKRLDLSYSAIEEVPSSIGCLTYLEELDLRGCIRLKRLPTSIYNLKSLQLLNIRECLNLESFPEILEKMEHLEHKSITEPPSSITKIPQDIDNLSSLESLYLSRSNFESLPANIKHLSRLRSLGLCYCGKLKSLPELPLSLELIEAWYCKQLQSLPEILPSLEELDTSILEMLPNDYRCEFTSEFYFFGCLKLNETANNKILADSQLRIHHMAIASFRRSIEKEFCGGLGGSVIVFPGNEIPEWFNNQSSGSSITIKLPQNSYRNLIGFALCAVINYYDEADPLFFKIRTPDETKYPLVTFYFQAGFSSNPDDVMLGFYPCRVVHTTLSFKFIDPAKTAKVKCCGVCPVYANPNETKPNTFTLKFDEEIRILDDEAGTSGASAIVGTSYEGELWETSDEDELLENLQSP